MPRFRFTGSKPYRIGTQKVQFGDEVELPAAPNRLFELIVPPRPVPRLRSRVYQSAWPWSHLRPEHAFWSRQ